MAFKTIGYIAKKKAPKKGKYIKLTESLHLEASKDNPAYLQIFDVRQKEGQSPEEFETLKSWNLGNVVLVVED